MRVPIRYEHVYTKQFADGKVGIAQDEKDLRFMVRHLKQEITRKKDYSTTTIVNVQNNIGKETEIKYRR